MSLKNQMEKNIADAIYLFAGKDSLERDVTIDPDLLLNSSQSGTVFPQEHGNGPLVKVFSHNLGAISNEFGSNDYTSTIMGYVFELVGVTKRFSDQETASKKVSDFEELIRTRVPNIHLNITTLYPDGLRGDTACFLVYGNSSFDIEQFISPNPIPRIYQPIPTTGNSGKVSLVVNTSKAYEGRASDSYTIRVTQTNMATFSLDGLMVEYFSLSDPTPVTVLADSKYFFSVGKNIEIKFIQPVNGVAQVGDSWTIDVIIQQDSYVGIFTQTYFLTSETISLIGEPSII